MQFICIWVLCAALSCKIGCKTRLVQRSGDELDKKGIHRDQHKADDGTGTDEGNKALSVEKGQPVGLQKNAAQNLHGGNGAPDAENAAASAFPSPQEHEESRQKACKHAGCGNGRKIYAVWKEEKAQRIGDKADNSAPTGSEQHAGQHDGQETQRKACGRHAKHQEIACEKPCEQDAYGDKHRRGNHFVIA